MWGTRESESERCDRSESAEDNFAVLTLKEAEGREGKSDDEIWQSAYAKTPNLFLLLIHELSSCCRSVRCTFPFFTQKTSPWFSCFVCSHSPFHSPKKKINLNICSRFPFVVYLFFFFLFLHIRVCRSISTCLQTQTSPSILNHITADRSPNIERQKCRALSVEIEQANSFEKLIEHFPALPHSLIVL